VKRRGIGSFLITASDNALLAPGYRELDLFTETNEPAVTLYNKLGSASSNDCGSHLLRTSCRSRGALGSCGSSHREEGESCSCCSGSR
jgi:hypothetical protein